MASVSVERKLPNGWHWARLGEVVAEVQVGFATGERDPDGVIQLRMNNVTAKGQFDWSSFVRVPADPETIQFYSLEVGDVLFNNTNSVDLVGKTALFEGYGEPVVFSNHFTRLRASNKALSAHFLALWLQVQWQRRLFANICNRWVGQAAVQRDKLLALEIPLPPFAEQQRIAAILNEQMAAVERAREAAEARLEATKALPAACLRQVFESEEAKRWPRRRLGEVCQQETGTRDPQMEPDIQFQYVDITAIDNRAKRIVATKTLLGKDAPSRARQVICANDVIVSTTRPNLNAVALVPPELHNQICSTGFCVLRGNGGLSPAYLFALVQSREFIRSLSELVTGALYPAVTDRQVRAQIIPVPPLAEQRRISAYLSERMAGVEKVKNAVEEQLDAINTLPAALLRRAFSGEL